MTDHLPDWANDPAFIYRFARRVTWTKDPDECSEFNTDEPNNYGQIQYNGTQLLAHRVATVLETREPLPPGSEVHHHCENPPCVNPHHLAVLSSSDHAAVTVARRSDSRSNVTPHDVVGIKMCLEYTDMTHPEIAELHGLDPECTVVDHISAGNSWTDIEIPA